MSESGVVGSDCRFGLFGRQIKRAEYQDGVGNWVGFDDALWKLFGWYRTRDLLETVLTFRAGPKATEPAWEYLAVERLEGPSSDSPLRRQPEER